MGSLTNQEMLDSMKSVLDSEAMEIGRLYDAVDHEMLLQVADEIKGCRGKIITTGCGTSGTAGAKISHTFNCIDRPSFFLDPSEADHGGMGVIGPEDLLILISNGGHTSELEPIAATAKKRGTKIICVTENPDSPLAESGDLVLKIRVTREPDPFNMLATASTLSVIAVFDALIITVSIDEGYTKDQFLEIHPGGEVGRRLAGELGKSGSEVRDEGGNRR